VPPHDPARAVATYRELAPAPELFGLVRAYFSFVPGGARWLGLRAVTRDVRFGPGESFCSPVFAAGRASLVMHLGASCHVHRGWTFGMPLGAHAIGALRAVGSGADESRPEMLGVYLEPGAAWHLLQVPAIELTDQVAELAQLWGSESATLASDLAALNEVARVDRMEAVLLSRLRRASTPHVALDIAGLARWVREEPTRMTVRRLAEAAGVSRRHLTRVFREIIGVSPKRYCRLARFQSGLVHAGAGACVPWARVASELGYADQSHMIAEFRELSGLTPECLATQQWFHPFIMDARTRVTGEHVFHHATLSR
jgi:AraC-like DNA-binding protein